MKAVGYHSPLPITAENSLIDLELPEPAPRPGDLLVRVQAISVNPVDVKVRAGVTPPVGEAKILGWEAAGIVEAVGAEVTSFRPGDAVFYAGAIDRPGANSELHLVDARIVGRKPASLSPSQAAALPLTAITAWELLFDRLGVPYGTKNQEGALLIINGAGGVGSILIQLARYARPTRMPSRFCGRPISARRCLRTLKSIPWSPRSRMRFALTHARAVDPLPRDQFGTCPPA